MGNRALYSVHIYSFERRERLQIRILLIFGKYTNGQRSEYNGNVSYRCYLKQIVGNEKINNAWRNVSVEYMYLRKGPLADF